MAQTRHVSHVALGHPSFLVKDPQLGAVHLGGSNVCVGPEEHMLELGEFLVGLLDRLLLGRLLLGRGVVPHVLLGGEDVVFIVYNGLWRRRGALGSGLLQRLVSLLHERHGDGRLALVMSG